MEEDFSSIETWNSDQFARIEDDPSNSRFENRKTPYKVEITINFETSFDHITYAASGDALHSVRLFRPKFSCSDETNLPSLYPLSSHCRISVGVVEKADKYYDDLIKGDQTMALPTPSDFDWYKVVHYKDSEYAVETLNSPDAIFTGDVGNEQGSLQPNLLQTWNLVTERDDNVKEVLKYFEFGVRCVIIGQEFRTAKFYHTANPLYENTNQSPDGDLLEGGEPCNVLFATLHKHMFREIL